VLAVVVGVQNVRVDGEVVLVLLVVGVPNGGAVVDAPEAIDRVGVEEQGIGQAGLARGAVPDECNVPNVLDQVLKGLDMNPFGRVEGRQVESRKVETRRAGGRPATLQLGTV